MLSTVTKTKHKNVMNTVSQPDAQDAIDCRSMPHFERTVRNRLAETCTAMRSELVG